MVESASRDSRDFDSARAQKEEDRAAEQQLHVAHQRQVEMMEMERDRELDEEESAKAKAEKTARRASRACGRASKGEEDSL